MNVRNVPTSVDGGIERRYKKHRHTDKQIHIHTYTYKYSRNIDIHTHVSEVLWLCNVVMLQHLNALFCTGNFHNLWFHRIQDCKRRTKRSYIMCSVAPFNKFASNVLCSTDTIWLADEVAKPDDSSRMCPEATLQAKAV